MHFEPPQFLCKTIQIITNMSTDIMVNQYNGKSIFVENQLFLKVLFWYQ